MRHVVDYAAGQGDDYEPIGMYGNFRSRVSQAYGEIEYPVQLPAPYPAAHLVVYFIFLTQSSFLLSTCFDDLFDNINQLRRLPDTFLRRHFVAAIEETWPRVNELLIEGDRQDLANAALRKMADPDDGLSKWILCMSYDAPTNIDHVQQLYAAPGFVKSVNGIKDLSAEVYGEMLNRQVDQVQFKARVLRDHQLEEESRKRKWEYANKVIESLETALHFLHNSRILG